jgi:uncharacterized Zn finger protein
MFCKHQYGKVDGKYQYCEKCGKAIEAPLAACNHRWVIERKFERINTINRITWAIYLMRCQDCGEMKQMTVGFD